MPHWSLADIPWDSFDPAKVDPDLLRIVKAASMVEINAGDYVRYLERVFAADRPLLAAIAQWGDEEAQHGAALAAWAQRADPDFDFAAARAAFSAGFRVDTEVARKIAADELRHYKLFYDGAKRYQQTEGISLWARLKVAFGRIVESEDDELAYAYYAANAVSAPYERKRWTREYAARAYAIYRRPHIDRGIAMILKAVGFNPTGRLHRLLSGAAWAFMRRRVEALGKTAGVAA
jgi:hypothetical protein